MPTYNSAVQALATKMAKMFQEAMFNEIEPAQLNENNPIFGERVRDNELELDQIAVQFGMPMRQVEQDVQNAVEKIMAPTIATFLEFNDSVLH